MNKTSFNVLDYFAQRPDIIVDEPWFLLVDFRIKLGPELAKEYRVTSDGGDYVWLYTTKENATVCKLKYPDNIKCDVGPRQANLAAEYINYTIDTMWVPSKVVSGAFNLIGHLVDIDHDNDLETLLQAYAKKARKIDEYQLH